MESRSLVPHSPGLKLPIANLRQVFRPHDVERKLAKLSSREHEQLRATYERMLERGPDRFQVKPSGIPEMADLYEQLPNFTEALDDVKRHVALSQDAGDGLEVTPMLLLGPPGIGKTHFARQLAELLGTGMNLVPMSSMTAGWLISGASSQWKGAKPGKVFEALVDASQVIWIMTANDERCIPEPILNRMNVFEIDAPTLEQARGIAHNLYTSIRRSHGWGNHFDPQPADDVLDLLAELAPREMRRALMTAFGNARLAKRGQIEAEDLPKSGAAKGRIGFLQ